jgi:hypothetical protein
VPKPTKAYGKRTGKFKSKFEASIAENLTHRGVPFAYESERLSYVLPPKWYTPDFVIKGSDELRTWTVFVEAKGWFKSADRTKLLAVKAANPAADIRLLFMRGKTKLYKGSNTTYAQWAEENGFPWAEGVSIPKEWLK